MNNLSLIFRILAIVAAVAAGALFYMGQGKLAEQKAAVEAAQKSTAIVQGELSAANERVAALESQLSSERNALSQAKRDLENTRSEMYTARQEVSRTQQQLIQARDKIENLENTAKRLRSELVEVEQSLADSNQATDEINVVNERVVNLEKRISELSAELEAARNTTITRQRTTTPSHLQSGDSTYSSGFAPTPAQPLPTVSIGPETTVQSISLKNGLIVLANTPEIQLSPGNQITLVQNMQALGKISVTQTNDDFIVANILPGAKARSLSPGSSIQLLR